MEEISEQMQSILQLKEFLDKLCQKFEPPVISDYKRKLMKKEMNRRTLKTGDKGEFRRRKGGKGG